MDGLVEIHDEFLIKITKLCMLDKKSSQLHDAVEKVLQLSLDFRQLCKKFLIDSDTLSDENDDDLSFSDYNSPTNKKNDDGSMGRGLLKVNNPHFVDLVE